MTTVDETDVITGQNQPVGPEGEISPYLTLSNGQEIRVVRLRTRELFKGVKILTRGAGFGMQVFANMQVNDQRGMAQQIAFMIAMAIPEAEDEAMEFLNAICEPKDLLPERKGDKAAEQNNYDEWFSLGKLLTNPPVEDTMNILLTMTMQEIPEFVRLGKELRSILAIKMPQLLKFFSTSTESSTPDDSSESSPEDSTSSLPSTVTPTDKYSTSP